MFIENGRSEFYQWDINQRLIVTDNNVIEVHFTNATIDNALICEVYEDKGKRVANVPNILLQSYWTIKAFGCCAECVRAEKYFTVVARNKPDDYVYTETEAKTFNTLVKHIQQNYYNKAETDEMIDNIQPDMSGYYTKEETDTAIKNNVPDIDLTGYATESYVNDKVAAIDIPETDLSDYYTKAETNSAINQAKPDLTDYYTKKETDSAISKAQPDLTNYYTKVETNNEINKAQPDLTPYAKKTDIPNLDGYATEKFVNDAIGNIEVAQKQADWAQTDETAADYVKNKPFRDVTSLEEVFPETEIVGEDDGSGVFIYTSGLLTFDADSNITVVFDGTTYDLKPVKVEDYYAYGNLAILGDVDTGEPFAIVSLPNIVAQMFLLDGNPHNVSISANVTKTFTMDEKYRPANVLYWNNNEFTGVSPTMYIYTDENCTTKATMEDIRKAVESNVGVILKRETVYNWDGVILRVVMAQTPPLYIEIGDEYSRILITIGESATAQYEGVVKHRWLYSAEYVPETT